MKVAAFLPVKGHSDRVPNKNTRPFNGEPFFCFALRKLLTCRAIDTVYLDSEDPEILRIGERLGAVPLPRDPALASNATDGHALFYNEVRRVEADLYVQVLCTAPFLSARTIDGAVRALMEAPEHDSAVLVRRDKVYEWGDGLPLYGVPIPNSDTLDGRVSEAMSLYVVRRSAARRTRRRIGDTTLMIECNDPLELVDVNTLADFRLAETIAAGLLARETRRHRMLAAFLSSELLSDVCDDLGVEAVLPGRFRANFERKVLGRARPMKLAPDRDPQGIYEALNSYERMAQDDVIVVQGHPELAYFGELNASLAIRSGAQAAVIDGMTRDTAATRRAGFPVWARGRTCRDVRGRMGVESINEPLDIGGVAVAPSALVFADEAGIVVLPPEREREIVSAALEAMAGEGAVRADILLGIGTDELVRRHGLF